MSDKRPEDITAGEAAQRAHQELRPVDPATATAAGPQNDAAPIEDSYSATLTNTETGEVTTSGTGSAAPPISEAPTKGPDPSVWGSDEDRPQGGGAASTLQGMEVGEIKEDPELGVIKGPGEEWRQDENGEYINR